MIVVIGGHPDDWGYILSFLDDADPRPVKEQFHAKYIGGWNKFEGFKWDRKKELLTYGEGEDADPPMKPISMALFRHEIIILFPHAWVMVVQCDDESWEISRMD